MSHQQNSIYGNKQQEPEIQPGSDRSFAFVFTFVFALIGLLPLLFTREVHLWALAIAAIFLGLGLVAPRLLHPLNVLWFKFGMLLHAVINPLMMGLIFFLAVLPTGMIMRILGKDLLKLQKEPQADSYWIKRIPPGPQKGTMKNQF